ncbi:MAG: response regulator [Thermodesulfobacteriota bacterium]
MAELIAGKGESATLLTETILSDLSKKYRKRLVAFVNPDVSPSREEMIKAFAQRDREKLLQICKPLFTVLQNENPDFATVGWILPDNRVFLRLTNPGKFGDDISMIRPDVAAVNRDRTQQTGFNVGIRSMQYRIIQPVFYQGEYVGAVQFGISAATIVDSLRNKLHTVSGIAVVNSEWSAVLTPAPSTTLKTSTHTICSRDIELFAPIQDQLDWSRGQQRMILNGAPHVILSVLPLKNYLNQELGIFFVALDISEVVAERQKILASTLLASAVLLLFSFLILYFSYGSLVQKIINLNLSLEKSNLELEQRVQERTARLEESGQRLQRILDKAPVGILIADVKAMHFQYANPTICEMLGYSKGDLVDMPLDAIHPPADIDQVKKTFQEQAEGERVIATDIPFQRKNGTFFEGDVITAPIEIEEQACLIGFIIDITERKKLEMQLRRSQKMEAIGLMAGGVAHDLNNILAGIVSYPELMLLKLPQSSEQRRPLEAIKSAGERAAAVVADLLTVARGVAVTLETHNVNDLIRDYLASPEWTKLASMHPEVACSLQLEAEQSTISCSPMHISKSLMNLLINAMEAMNYKGEIRISTRNQWMEPTGGRDDDLTTGLYLVISVQDNGPGIAPKDLDNIFEPFYTKKVMGQSGTGLGLAIVWNTLQDHHGKIFTESDEEGTSFHLYFPVNNGTPDSQPEKSEHESLYGTGEHILVVDDEPQLRDIASQILRTLGYKVDSVGSGELALDFLEHHRVELLIIDMLMEPGMNGRESYEEIVARFPGQKAIIASGFAENEDVRTALQLGATSFLKKPFSVEQLGQAVRDALTNS